MNFNYQTPKSDMSTPIISKYKGNASLTASNISKTHITERPSSPFTPLYPMEGSSFDFSPRVIARCLNQTTPKISIKNRRSSPQSISAQEVSFGRISPIESTSANEDIFYKVPANSPVCAASADFGTKSMHKTGLSSPSSKSA